GIDHCSEMRRTASAGRDRPIRMVGGEPFGQHLRSTSMQMSADDIKDFPKLHQYVSVQIPLVRLVGPIIAEIKKQAGEIDSQTIKDALIWGQGPMINVVVMDPLGEFTPNTSSNELRIQKAMVKQFEAGKGLRRTAKGRLVYLVGVTLLHELTHWA